MPAHKQHLPTRFWIKVEKTEGCWLWTGATIRDGYGTITIDGRSVKAHRIAWELTYGPIPEGMLVCHRCDNPSCVRPDHLFLGTHADNVHDCIQKGRRNTPTGEQSSFRRHPEQFTTFRTMPRPKGEAHGLARLTWNQVREIRAKRTIGHSLNQLARAYNVSQGTICHIVAHRTWKENSNDQ